MTGRELVGLRHFIFGQQKRLKPLRDKGLTSIYDFS